MFFFSVDSAIEITLNNTQIFVINHRQIDEETTQWLFLDFEHRQTYAHLTDETFAV